MGTTYDVPPDLSASITDGRCIAFVGAGFSAAAGLPGWGSLLRQLLAGCDPAPELEAFVHEGIQRGTAHAFDEAAQALEDELGRERFIELVAALLGEVPANRTMGRRIELLHGIPFRGVLTTNFDHFLQGDLPSRSTYRRALRPERFRWWEPRFWASGEGAFTVKLHGDLAGKLDASGIVLTRRDYRRRLYADTGYGTFLRGLLATSTVLYLGFSFEDAYLNELRSEVLALLGHDASDQPIGYAVMNDVSDATRQHFRRHEGIEILTYGSSGKTDFSGFDGWLEAIHEASNPVARFGRYLRTRRLLWLDPRPTNNATAFDFLERAARAAGCALEPVGVAGTVDEALRQLRDAKRAGSPFDLVVTHWGEGRGRAADGGAVPSAVALLRAVRSQELEVPVVVFAADEDAERRKRVALGLGALDYCFSFDALFRRLGHALAPAHETG